MGMDRLFPAVILLVFCAGCSSPEEGQDPDGAGAGLVIAEALRLESEGEIGEAMALLTGWDGPPVRKSVCFETAGKIARRQGQPGLAAFYLDKALVGRPNDPDLLFQKGEALVDAGWERQAVDLLRECLDRDGGRQRTRLLLGEILFQMGRFNDAAACLDALDRDAVLDAQALILLGAVSFKTGRAAEALAFFERAATADRAIPDPDFNSGVVLLAEGDAAGAEKAYFAALGKDPDHLPSLFNLGRLLWSSGRREEGKRLLDAACAGETDVLSRRSMETTRARLLEEAAAGEMKGVRESQDPGSK